MILVNHALVTNFDVANMSFNAICENKVLAKISGFTVIVKHYCFSPLLIFSKLMIFFQNNFSKNSFRNTISVKQFGFRSGPEVIKLKYSLRLKIKGNDWLLADTCLFV